MGKGQFGTPRGQRTHNRLDIAVRPGQDVFAPIDGTVVRIAYPYEPLAKLLVPMASQLIISRIPMNMVLNYFSAYRFVQQCL